MPCKIVLSTVRCQRFVFRTQNMLRKQEMTNNRSRIPDELEVYCCARECVYCIERLDVARPFINPPVALKQLAATSTSFRQHPPAHHLPAA